MPRTERKRWVSVGPVKLGRYPYEMMAYGIEDEDGTKIGTTTRPEFAAQIVNLHNASLPSTEGQS